MLDEPTNHLDLQAIEWLEGFLRSCNRAFIVVSHDRYFLDKVTTRTLDMAFGRLEDYAGSYTRYLRLREERYARRVKEYEEQQEFIARTEEFIRKYKAGQRSKEARGRQTRLDRLERGQGGRVFWKPFYRRTDFDDERYRPMFSPVIDAGQKVSFKLWLDPWNGDGNLRIAPYVRRTMSGTIEETGAWHVPSSEGWQEVSFIVPDGNEAIDEVGIAIEYFGRLKFLGRLFLADFRVEGPGRARIDPNIEKQEWGAISRFTWNRGHWTLHDGRIYGHAAADADMWTGHYYARDLTVTADVRRVAGASQLLTARVQGTGRFYAAGFDGDDAVILKEDFGTTELARVPFRPETGRSYRFGFTVEGDRLAFSIDGKPLLEARDTDYAYGMVGLRMAGPGRMGVGTIEIVES
jgi:hypothetical protein